MHPRVFLDNFWRNDLENEVFVAMSFDPKYERRWEEIFKPAIEGQPIAGLNLRAVRVDNRKSGDSILTEINDGIAHSQLVLADISVTDRWEEHGRQRYSRNGNVMYEVGLALACRQPVEVVIVRDDLDQLLFDVSHIPVMHLDPNTPLESAVKVHHAIADRLKERNLLKDLRISRTLESLSQMEISLIRATAEYETFGWKKTRPLSMQSLALPSLLEKRIMRFMQPATANQPDGYTWTALGKVIRDYLKSNAISALPSNPSGTSDVIE